MNIDPDFLVNSLMCPPGTSAHLMIGVLDDNGNNTYCKILFQINRLYLNVNIIINKHYDDFLLI